jgi:hypothetical protein
MAFSPFIKNSTLTLDVTSTASADVPTPSAPTGVGTNLMYPAEALIYNAGPSVAFYDKAAAGESTDANVTDCPPLPAGSMQAITVGKDVTLAFVSEGTSKLYVTFGGGDLQGFGSLAAAS